ncbi:MAG TPA: PrsW family intramembrane metalloprotease [Pyrinomonadaceae bacterium]|jgi:RsiW-degrading membrane proteinase PrsW (M82 family)
MMNQNPMMNPGGGGAYYPQPVMYRPSNNRRAIKWVLGIFVLLVMLLVGQLTLYMIGYNMEWAALQTGVLLALLPVPIYLLLILWLDRYESEPLWMLALSFLWGATFAAFIAIIVNSIGARAVAEAYGVEEAMFYGLVISAPVVEEFSKAFVLFVIFFWKKDEFDGIMDGIVYAGMVGLGFAMTENIKYYGDAAMASMSMRMDHVTPTFFLRGGLAAFAHPLFTSMTGIGLGWARQSTSKAIKITMPFLGLILAMCVHATWNYSAWLAQQYRNGLIFFGVYGAIMIPIFSAVLVSVYFALRREGRVVRDFLYYDLNRGLFTPEDYYRLCTVRGRMGASMRALTRGGFGHWRTRMQYHQTASELAFHRCRIARGLTPWEQQSMERERAYVQLLFELRRRLGPH